MLKLLTAAALGLIAVSASACVIVVDKDGDDRKTRVYGPGSYDDIEEDLDKDVNVTVDIGD